MTDQMSVDENKAIGEIVERLRERFPDTPEAEIVAAVETARTGFVSARVRDFVPVLIEREAKARLTGTR